MMFWYQKTKALHPKKRSLETQSVSALKIRVWALKASCDQPVSGGPVAAGSRLLVAVS